MKTYKNATSTMQILAALIFGRNKVSLISIDMPSPDMKNKICDLTGRKDRKDTTIEVIAPSRFNSPEALKDFVANSSRPVYIVVGGKHGVQEHYVQQLRQEKNLPFGQFESKGSELNLSWVNFPSSQELEIAQVISYEDAQALLAGKVPATVGR